MRITSLIAVTISLIAFTTNACLAAPATIHVPKDHHTIQAAIDAAKTGDIVLVAAGIYKQRITLKPGITLKSAGDDVKGKLGLTRAEATIINGGGEQDTSGNKGAGVTMAQGATIDGFTVTNVGLYDDAKWNKHHATQGEQQSYEHIGAPGVAGISVIGATCDVKNNIVHHVGYSGIAIMGGKDKNAGATSPHIYRNVCYRNMGGGIGSMRHSTAVIEQNTCFQNYYAGIGHENASPTVINNICYENIRAGIGISEGASPVVRGNKCYKNRRAGIGTRTGANTRPLIEGNHCYDNDMAGIGTREKAAPIIRNNRCYKNKLAGIGSRTGATPTIIGNECYENGQAGIGQMSDAVTVLIGNHCHHNKTSGIGFANCDKGRSIVIGNRLIDNATVAVGINPGWTVQLTGNELLRKGGLPPIVMVFAGSNATFTNNTITGGGVAGIRAAGRVRAVNNTFAGTSLRKGGPPNNAIWALPGADITMIGNTIHHWRHALLADKAKVSAMSNKVSDFHKQAFAVTNAVGEAVVRGNVLKEK